MATEKRLIDANKFLEKADEVTFMGFHAEERKRYFMDLVSLILDCVTVDAVEVVRCKDCKFGKMCSIREAMVCTVPEGFCWRGERKNNDK